MPRQSKPSPQRTCLGCNRRDDQNVMVRITLREGVPVVDPERRADGRGGYLHPNESCLRGFVRSRVREFRSLRQSIALDARRELSKRITELIPCAAG